MVDAKLQQLEELVRKAELQKPQKEVGALSLHTLSDKLEKHMAKKDQIGSTATCNIDTDLEARNEEEEDEEQEETVSVDGTIR